MLKLNDIVEREVISGAGTYSRIFSRKWKLPTAHSEGRGFIIDKCHTLLCVSIIIEKKAWLKDHASVNQWTIFTEVTILAESHNAQLLEVEQAVCGWKTM